MVSQTLRLNGAIRALERGDVAFVGFSPPDIRLAQAVTAEPYDGIVFELEHNPYDIQLLRHCLQYMLDRRQILESGNVAPAVTPLVRVPPNGAEMSQWVVKQVLDIGAYGIVFPHIDTVEQAHNAVGACRYPRPPSAPNFQPSGLRGDSARNAAKYWGLTVQEYYERADVWPLAPHGELLVVMMCESVESIRNLPKILKEVPGIGVVLVGDGDLSQELGHPRRYDHPDVIAAAREIVAICKDHQVTCGYPRVTAENAEELVAQGYRWLMPLQEYSFTALERGRKAAGRTA